MKVLLIASALCCGALATPAAADLAEDTLALRAIHRKLSRSVVQVDVVVREVTSTGVSFDLDKSAVGLVVASDGLILAPENLAPSGPANRSSVVSATVHLGDGRRFDAVHVGSHPESLTTFFRVEDPGFDALPVEFDSNDQLDVGDFIASIRLSGPNFGRVPYMDAFLVSAATPDPNRCYLTTFAVSDYLGGPVVSMDGRLVGVVGWMRFNDARAVRPDPNAPAPLFANVFGAAEDGREVVLVPASRLAAALADPPDRMPVAEQVRPSFLGVETQPLLPELARALGLPDDLRGVLLTRVLPGSPAARAGLRVSDLVSGIDGQPFTGGVENVAQFLAESIALREPGSLIDLDLIRGGKPLEVPVALEPAPLGPDEAATAESTGYGLAARDLVLMDRANQDLPLDLTGARITLVRRTGFAGLAGLKVGDIVTRLDDQPVFDAAGLCQSLDEAARSASSHSILFVVRGRETRFVHFQPDWSAAGSGGRTPASRASDH